MFELNIKSILTLSAAAAVTVGMSGCQANFVIKNGNFAQDMAYWSFAANVANAGGSATANVRDGTLRIDINSPGKET